jgi:hypothetical protein
MTDILAKLAALTKKDENGLLPCPICGDSGFIHRKLFGKDGRDNAVHVLDVARLLSWG